MGSEPGLRSFDQRLLTSSPTFMNAAPPGEFITRYGRNGGSPMTDLTFSPVGVESKVVTIHLTREQK
jgi:hypothetical protein